MTDQPDQPTLRDRIRRAICEASGFTWLPDELMEPDEYGDHADAVLAVLPEVADRAEEELRHWKSKLAAVTDGRDALQRENARLRKDLAAAERIRENADFHLGQEMARRQLAEKAAARLAVDRAAVLREAADAVRRKAVHDGEDFCNGIDFAADLLRRMADEAQQPEAEAVPAEAPSVCEGFQWIGQSFATCDRCDQPAWDHVGEDVPVEGASLSDERRTVRPWKPGQADAIRAKWSRPTS
ncbi:hypothetical protein ACIQVR_41075 [Streptomyces xanthochromogenes]|uniref:hypothetical protein n=1 Tax=Streptomyces xanthochromogenes TaxID=67384 RepID=UPI00382A7D16